MGKWLLLAKITLFFELVEYAIVMHIRFSNLRLDFCWKRGKCMKSEVSGGNRKSDEEVKDLTTTKCQKIDTWALLIFLSGSIIINIAFFAYYTYNFY